MPIYEYRCEKCGETTELLVLTTQETPRCASCGSEAVTKLMSAHNTTSNSPSFPTQADCACCGSQESCGSPGSCCAN